MNRVTLEFPSFQDFLRSCSPFISEQGMFLRTDEVQPVGAQVGFDVGLGDDFPILRGSGEVVWVVEPDAEGIGAPGMALRYRETDDSTQRLIRRIAERHREQTGEVFELERADASAALPAGETLEETPAEAPTEVEKPPAAAEKSTETAAPKPPADAPTDASPSEVVAAEESADVLSLPDPEAAPAVLPPGLAAAMAATEDPPRRGRTGLWIALAAVAIAAVGFWQRDFLTGKLGGGSEPSATSTVEAPPETVDVEAEPARSDEGASAESAADVGGAVEPGGEPQVADEVASPPQREPLTRIEDISWLSGEGSTLLMLRADGTFSEGGYKVESLGGDTPRAILKIAGVTVPYQAGTAEVGTAEVQRVRTGLHPSELHVVLDLASPAARVTSVEVDGVVLQVRVSTGAGSP